MPAPEFDADVLETALERREILAALADAPYHRQEIQEAFDVSKTTCHRIVRTFDEQGLLRRTDNGYTLSTKGELVAAQAEDYYANVRAACLLAPIAAAFEATPLEFDLEHFADARITRPTPDDPTRPINQDFQLFQDSETHITVDGNQYIPPLYMEKLAEIVVDEGMRFEHILPPDILSDRLSMFEDLHRRQLRGDIDAMVTYRVCEDVPFGLVLYDHSHVVVRAYDDETGSVTVMADTDDPAAVSWAEDVIGHYRERAQPPEAVEGVPDWAPTPDLDV